MLPSSNIRSTPHCGQRLNWLVCGEPRTLPFTCPTPGPLSNSYTCHHHIVFLLFVSTHLSSNIKGSEKSFAHALACVSHSLQLEFLREVLFFPYAQRMARSFTTGCIRSCGILYRCSHVQITAPTLDFLNLWHFFLCSIQIDSYRHRNRTLWAFELDRYRKYWLFLFFHCPWDIYECKKKRINTRCIIIAHISYFFLKFLFSTQRLYTPKNLTELFQKISSIIWNILWNDHKIFLNGWTENKKEIS